MITTELLCLSPVPTFAAPGYPLDGATVHARRISPGIGGGYDWTNETGQYAIDANISPGNYSVEASANGYLNGQANATISAVNETKTVNIVLNASGIVKGRVVGYDGRPVIGADVSLYKNTTHSMYIGGTTTDSNGTYYFATEVSTGNYYISVSFWFPFMYTALSITYGGNYTGVPTWSYMDCPYYDNGYVSRLSPSISAVAGSLTDAGDLVLARSGVIKGTVKNGRGDPVVHAAVQAFNYHMVSPSAVLTDENGNYKISYEISNGTYTIQAYDFGHVCEAVVMNVTDTDVVVQNFTMADSAKVSGHVYRRGDNRPVPNVQLGIVRDDYAFWQTPETGDNGFYEARTGLANGNYTVTASLNYEMLNMTTLSLSSGEILNLGFWVDVYFINGTVYENMTTSGVRVSYPTVSLDFTQPPYPSGDTAYGNVNGTYMMVVPATVGNGTAHPAEFTVSAYGYNTTVVSTNVTVGMDLTVDFALNKTVTPPPVTSATIMGTIYGKPGLSFPFSYQQWHLTSGNYTFTVWLNSSSGVENVYAYVLNGELSVDVWGQAGTTGYLTVWLPKNLYPGPTFTVTSYPGPAPTIVSQTDNADYFIITISYGHSSKYITFTSANNIPEYPVPMLLALLFTSVTAVAVFEKKRRLQIPR